VKKPADVPAEKPAETPAGELRAANDLLVDIVRGTVKPTRDVEDDTSRASSGSVWFTPVKGAPAQSVAAPENSEPEVSPSASQEGCPSGSSSDVPSVASDDSWDTFKCNLLAFEGMTPEEVDDVVADRTRNTVGSVVLYPQVLFGPNAGPLPNNKQECIQQMARCKPCLLVLDDPDNSFCRKHDFGSLFNTSKLAVLKS
jgi:hypothetical protein